MIDRARVAAKAAVGIFSEDSAKQAYGMLQGIFPGGMGLPPTRGTREYLKAYSQMPWLRAVAARVATKTSTTEWQLFVARKGAAKATRNRVVQRAYGSRRRELIKSLQETSDLEPIPEHPILDLLHDPNSFQHGDAMRKVTQLHLDLVGEAFWLKERDGLGQIVGLWPIPPDWVINTPTPTNRFFRVQFKGWRGMIPDAEFIWFADPDPSNPYGRGSGTAQALADELETDEYAAKHTKAFFFNRARPDLIVYPKAGVMRQPDVDRVEEDWMSKTQGFWRAFKPYFMTREVGVHELDQNFRAIQLVQLREFERNCVIQTFGVPPELLGVLQNANRATITAADLIMARYVVEPRLEFQRSIMQERLLPEFDERLILDFVSPVQEDKDFQLDTAKAAPYAQTIDEWRKLMGLTPHNDKKVGAMIAVPGTVSLKTAEEVTAPKPDPFAVDPVTGLPVPAPGVPKPPKPQPGTPVGGDEAPTPKPKPATPSGDEKPPSASGKVWRTLLYQDAQVCGHARDTETELFFLKTVSEEVDDLPVPSRAAATFEPAMARELTAVWVEARAAVDMVALLAAVTAGNGPGAEAALRGHELDARVREVLHGRLVVAFMRGAELGAEAIGVATKGVVKALTMDLGALNPEAESWARLHAAALVRANAETRALIRNLIVQAQAEGLPPDTVARMVRDVIGLTERQMQAVMHFHLKLLADGVPTDKAEARVVRYAESQHRYRALTIARTELIASTNGGQQSLWQMAARSGVISRTTMRRTWLVTWDERLESKCEALADTEVGLDEPFEPGLMHPPKHPRCRCAMGLVNASVGVPTGPGDATGEEQDSGDGDGGSD